MKKILLFVLAFSLNIGFGQQFRSIMIDPPGADSQYEYIELLGTPNQPLTGICFVVIEGDGADAGIIDQKIDLSSYSFGSNGLLLIRASSQLPVSAATSVIDLNFSPDLENDSNTFLLMDCPTQSVGSDLDTDNDGVLDGNPFNGKTIYDAVSVTDGGANDRVYASSLGGVNIPTKPSTIIAPAFIFKDGGTWYGTQIAALEATPTSKIEITSAWSNSGLTTAYNSMVLSNGNTPSPFPVTLLSFSANTINQFVNLEWETIDEKAFNHFFIERSRDAVGFESIAKMDAKASLTDELTTYEFTDETPAFGTNYYRLRMVDTDGTNSFSKIIAATVTEFSSVVVFPNPSSNVIRLNGFENENIQHFEIIDLKQQVIKKGKFVSEISIENLPVGTYILYLFADKQQVISRKFIKH